MNNQKVLYRVLGYPVEVRIRTAVAGGLAYAVVSLDDDLPLDAEREETVLSQDEYQTLVASIQANAVESISNTLDPGCDHDHAEDEWAPGSKAVGPS